MCPDSRHSLPVIYYPLLCDALSLLSYVVFSFYNVYAITVIQGNFYITPNFSLNVNRELEYLAVYGHSSMGC